MVQGSEELLCELCIGIVLLLKGVKYCCVNCVGKCGV